MLPSFSPVATAAAAAPPPRPIPGSYGPPVLGPLRDRLDYFWFQGPEEFFRRRAAQHGSTVFRANIPPTFPGVDPRVVAVVDAASFTALFDPSLVDKRDCLIGPYNPGVGFTGGTRVGVYLDTEEPEHARTKAFAMDLLRRSSRTWAAEFLAGVDGMLATVEAELDKGAEAASYLFPLQQCIFRFLCKALVGADPAADSLVDRFGSYILDIWLGLQLVPTQKIGAIPQPLEELLLHSFPLPSFVVKPGYDLLYRFVEKHGAEAVAVAEKEHGISVKDAINNILFVLGFNAFGGFSVFLPFLILEVGKDTTGLRPRLREEVRRALENAGDGGEVGFAAVREMPLVRSTVYEVLRMQPPVPLQFGRARRDFVLRSHGGTGYAVSRGELLCGYQTLAMRDPAVFERPEEFVPERFVGEEGEALLRYVYWSNGPETGETGPGNKQCAAKDAVVATACMLIAELFRRYDDFECDGTSFIKLQKRQQQQPKRWDIPRGRKARNTSTLPVACNWYRQRHLTFTWTAGMTTYRHLDPTVDIRHRGRLLEEGEKLPVLITRTPQEDWMIHPDWVDRLAWAGLLPLARMVEATAAEWRLMPQDDDDDEPREQYNERSRRFGYDRSLITCLVDRWRPETHTLHFPWGEMAPTLQDVSFLLGLPLAGAAVGPLEPQAGWHEDIVARFAGVAQGVGELVRDTNGPMWRWLRNFQIGALGYPGVALTEQQVDRCLEAYILWLFDKVMFTSNHVNTVDARYIGIAREIADARCREDIVPRSWGSAVLAATLRGMCNGCSRRAEKSAVLGCPLLLQLWSYERFPVGRPDVQFDVPYDETAYHGDLIDMPTFGTLWTRRRVRYASEQVRNCYPAFTSQFDTLHPSQVIWEPYTDEALTRRAPGGISLLCTRDLDYWMTKATVVFDVTVEITAVYRVMRQFGKRQLCPPPAPPLLQPHIHRYSRKGGNKTATTWARNLAPFVERWTTASADLWHEDTPFDQAEYDVYLQWYRPGTRLFYVPRADPDEMQQGRTSDYYPTASVVGVRHHAAQLTLEAQEEVAALLNRLDMGVDISPSDHRSAWRRLNGKLRKIYETLTCARASDVAPGRSSRHEHRPPRRSSSSWQPQPQVQPRPPLPTQAGGSLWHQQPQSSPQPTPPLPTQAGGSTWHHQPHSSPQPAAPLPTQAGGSSWHHQPYSSPQPAAPLPTQAGGSSWHHQPYSTPQPAAPLPTQAGGSSWHHQSMMFHGTGDAVPVLAFAGSPDTVEYGDMWTQADASGIVPHFPGFQTPPPPPTQVTQSPPRQPDQPIYGRGHRRPQPVQPLTLSGPRKRPRPRTRRAAPPAAPRGGPGGHEQGDEQE